MHSISIYSKLTPLKELEGIKQKYVITMRFIKSNIIYYIYQNASRNFRRCKYFIPSLIKPIVKKYFYYDFLFGRENQFAFPQFNT